MTRRGGTPTRRCDIWAKTCCQDPAFTAALRTPARRNPALPRTAADSRSGSSPPAAVRRRGRVGPRRCRWSRAWTRTRCGTRDTPARASRALWPCCGFTTSLPREARPGRPGRPASHAGQHQQPSPHVSPLSNPAVTDQHPSGTTLPTAASPRERGPTRCGEPAGTRCSQTRPADPGGRGRARPVSRAARRPPSRNAGAGGRAGRSHMMFFSSYHINNVQAESPG